MADLTKHVVYKNSQYEILTDQGFKPFVGIIAGSNPNKITLTVDNNKQLTCTPKHKIPNSFLVDVYAEDLNVGDVIYGGGVITNTLSHVNEDKVYDILEVEGVHRYYVNDILSSQCLLLDELAFIEPASILDDFWRSVYPTISRSATAKVLIASTPNGTGNLFHKLFDGAEKGENGFVYERVRWYDIPGRDEAWKQNEIKSMGSLDSFLQEYETVFLESGESSIDAELFEEMSRKCIDAKIILDDGNYKIWEEPDPSKIYVAGVDISEGVGADASVIQILDITDTRDIKQVAVYHSRNIPPLEFANKVHTILLNWGSPLALIERNNCGAQVVDRLAFDIGYEKVVSYGAKAALRGRPQMGMIAHTNTKYKGVMNMRYFINETHSVTIHDLNTLKEMRDFVRYPNGTWKAKGGYHDDRVMSFMYALYILEKEITERYFDILELDDHGKPMIIEPMDFGIATFENATSIYNDFEVVGLNNNYMTPVVFGMGHTEQYSEMDMLSQEGWKPYGH